MNALSSHPFLVYRVVRRGERISQIRSKPAGQITSCFRIARIMQAGPFSILCNILSNSRQLFGRWMLGKDRVECKHNGKALECMIALEGFVRWNCQKRSQSRFKLTGSQPIEFILVNEPNIFASGQDTLKKPLGLFEPGYVLDIERSCKLADR